MIICKIFSSKQFSYNPATRAFAGFMSELPGCIRQIRTEDVVMGFGMESWKTLVVVLFKISRIQRNADNDITAWHFEPTEDSITFNPQIDGVTAIIYNT
jgi:predicted RNase H-like HicB family nuclease